MSDAENKRAKQSKYVAKEILESIMSFFINFVSLQIKTQWRCAALMTLLAHYK